MTDEIRTECGRKDKKSIIISAWKFITVAAKMTYHRSISSAFTCKGYFVHFFDGVSFRDRNFSDFYVSWLLLAYKHSQISAGQKSSQGKYPANPNCTFKTALELNKPESYYFAILLECSPLASFFLSSKLLLPTLKIYKRNDGKDVQ